MRHHSTHRCLPSIKPALSPLLLLSIVAALTLAHTANAQQPTATAIVDHALQSGDGQSSDTAYAVPGLLWEYALLNRLNLRFRNQRAVKGLATDVISTRDPKTGDVRDVWFRATTPSAPDQAETDRVARTIATSGDGMSPETAFVVGGHIGAEYQLLSLMGIKSNMQALLSIRGCSFDRLSGRDIDTDEPRDVYFKLGSPDFDYKGACVLRPTPDHNDVRINPPQ